MPPRKTADAHRSLELLEEYHAQLKDDDDEPLRTAIERIMRIFRDRLFQALLDIQDLHDATLVDADKESEAKTQEALEMAMLWEQQSPMPASGTENSSATTSTSTTDSLTNGRDVQPSSPMDADFEETVIVLTKRPGKGLGFSIAGGVDNQHRPGDNRVYCTKVYLNGVATEDGRLRVEDMIVQVNDTPLENVNHTQAVQSLTDAVSTVVLRIRRPSTGSDTNTPDHGAAVSTLPALKVSPTDSPPAVEPAERQSPQSNVQVIVLEKGTRGLGFSIAGGVGNQRVAGDNAIFVAKVIPGGVADGEGSLQVNDKLLKVNDAVLDNASHAEAVQALQRASGTTYLTVEKTAGANMLSSSVSPGPATAAKSPSEYPNDSRKVTLQKGDKGLGFNIVGGEESAGGIYISYIVGGGVADSSGQLKRGDQILEVNTTDLTNASHKSAVQAITSSGGTVSLVVAYRPEEFGVREKVLLNAAGVAHSSPTKPRSSHVRALFDYDKNSDAGAVQGERLSFRHGDILHLITAGEGDWWTAKRVNPETGEPEGQAGTIPSCKRVEQKERTKNRGKKLHRRASSAADMKPDPPLSGLKRRKSFTFSKRLPFFRKQEKENKKSEGDGEEPLLFYEDVRMEEITYKRPIVILGPLKDHINDNLIQEFPEKFGSCVPHTTRPRKDEEVDGRDYHFVGSREQMEHDIQNHLFIEAGQYTGNLYGSSVAAVKEVAIGEQKHCVLDVSGDAIHRLQAAALQPIAIFLKPGSAEAIMSQSRWIKPQQAQKTFERALKLGEEYAEYLTAIIEPGSQEEVYGHVKRVILQHSANRIWVRTRE